MKKFVVRNRLSVNVIYPVIFTSSVRIILNQIQFQDTQWITLTRSIILLLFGKRARFLSSSVFIKTTKNNLIFINLLVRVKEKGSLMLKMFLKQLKLHKLSKFNDNPVNFIIILSIAGFIHNNPYKINLKKSGRTKILKMLFFLTWMFFKKNTGGHDITSCLSR